MIQLDSPLYRNSLSFLRRQESSPKYFVLNKGLDTRLRRYDKQHSLLCAASLLFLVLLFSPSRSFSQEGLPYLLKFPDIMDNSSWQLVVQEEGLKIYTKTWPGSNFVAVKTDQTVRTTMKKVIANTLDADGYADWIGGSTGSALLKISDDQKEIIYHLKIGAPWPLKDRDLVAGLRISQDPESKAIIVDEWNESQFIPEEKGHVRIPRNISQSVAIPLGDGRVRTIWQGHNEPGGWLPAWVVNWTVKSVFLESARAGKIRLETQKLKDPPAWALE